MNWAPRKGASRKVNQLLNLSMTHHNFQQRLFNKESQKTRSQRWSVTDPILRHAPRSWFNSMCGGQHMICCILGWNSMGIMPIVPQIDCLQCGLHKMPWGICRRQKLPHFKRVTLNLDAFDWNKFCLVFVKKRKYTTNGYCNWKAYKSYVRHNLCLYVILNSMYSKFRWF